MRDLLDDARVLDGALAQAHVRQTERGDALGAAREARGAAIDGDDAVVERRQQRQERALARADVDGERAARQERREHGQQRQELPAVDDDGPGPALGAREQAA